MSSQRLFGSQFDNWPFSYRADQDNRGKGIGVKKNENLETVN
uniref:Uncharacterized protein n=1 Tax=Onchocerca volvulus TaxID=6282 RepID=A0A8R1XPQ6_ONCVO